jgi:signal transduction histidine kinase
VRGRFDPLTVDRVLAVTLVIAAGAQAWVSGGTAAERTAGIAVGAVVGGSVAVRRRYPAAVGIGVQAVLAATAALSLTMRPSGPPVALVGWLCALYALAAWATRRWFVAGLAFFVASDLVPAFVSSRDSPSTVIPFTVVTAAVMVLVRIVVGGRDERLRLAERERDVRAREAVVEERARIARELHDAIAHNVSMMVLQAGAERRVIDDGSTKEVLATIEQIGRDALTEMRRLVGMLRAGDDHYDLRAPQPGLDDVPLLVDQVRSAGLPVDLAIEGDRRPLPVGIELSAFRIVQEALTNALKHAGTARAEVRVRYDVDSLELEIVDDGAGPASGVMGGGHGLAGMRERVVLYGGRLDAGRRDAGGYRVRVVLPIR